MRHRETVRVHIFPADAQHRSFHQMTPSGCWCEPTPRQVCPESDEVGQCQPGCYRCGGTGWVWWYDAVLPIVLLHSGQMHRAVMA